MECGCVRARHESLDFGIAILMHGPAGEESLWQLKHRSTQFAPCPSLYNQTTGGARHGMTACQLVLRNCLLDSLQVWWMLLFRRHRV